MKKFLLLALTAAALASCDNNYEDADTKAEQQANQKPGDPKAEKAEHQPDAAATPGPMHDTTGN